MTVTKGTICDLNGKIVRVGKACGFYAEVREPKKAYRRTRSDLLRPVGSTRARQFALKDH